MNNQLIKIAEKINKYNQINRQKEWIELTFRYGVWINGDYDESGIEWVASRMIGISRDGISIQHNYFGDTPQEVLDKLEKDLKL